MTAFPLTSITERAMAVDGLTTIRSGHGPKDTMSRLEAEVKARGLTVFARIDHAAGATAVGLPLRPTEVLVFGNAKGGTPLMQSVQTIGIDLPLKVLVWQDASGDTWVSYNDPAWLAKRHGVSGAAEAVLGNMSAALQAVARAATTLQIIETLADHWQLTWQIISSGRAAWPRRFRSTTSA